MTSIAQAAAAHMRTMEARIEQQTTLIVKLKADGRDVTQPTRTLTMLRNVLEEMRFQLDRLMPAAEREQWRAISQSSHNQAS